MHHLKCIVALLITLIAVQVDLYAAPATVDTSTVATATASSAQRKTFFDSENEVHWAFYYNGTEIEYSYSADGTTWTPAGTLAYNTAIFSVLFRTISGTSYVFVVAEANTYDVVLRRGLLDESSIVFDAEQTIFDGSSATDRYTKPTLALSENNHLWISSIKDFGATNVERFQSHIRRLTNAADGDLSALNAATAIGNGVRTLRDAVIMPQNGDGMYLLLSTNGSNIVGYTYDGVTWSAANTGGDYSWFGFGKSGLSAQVYAIAISGTDIYAGGTFGNAGGVFGADKIARWDGERWHSLGDGLNNTVTQIVVSGSDVYVGGSFTDAGGIAEADRIARWDGTNWNALGAGLNNTVSAIAISGGNIYAGGSFQDAGGIVAADRIARWDGSDWYALGAGLNNPVNTIAISGSDLYAGGTFTDAGGIGAADRIARWNGAAWSALGSGISTSSVIEISISGSDVYAGGSFTGAGGVANTARIARWNGATWNAVGTGIASGQVNIISISGTDVYVGGTFVDAGGNADADRIVRRDTSNNTWNAISSGVSGTVSAIAISGSNIYVGGVITDVGGIAAADFIAQWDGSSWHAFDSGGIGSIFINAMGIIGNDVYVAGQFVDLAGIPDADNIARWDGIRWHALGLGAFSSGGYVTSMAVSGNDIYIGGRLFGVGGVANANGVAKWDGANWSALGSGVGLSYPDEYVYTVAVVGSRVYVGGNFFTYEGNVADGFMYWDGTSWNAVSGSTGGVMVLCANGSDLYVGGSFVNAGGIAEADGIAKWDGTSWSALGAGISSNTVYSIAVSGSNVYVGGAFTDVAGIANADRIALWDGASWNALGTGLSTPIFQIVLAGSDVYVGGNFTDAGGAPEADTLVRWDGASWNTIGTGLTGTVNSIALRGNEIYVGGSVGLVGKGQATSLAYYAPAIATDADATSEISAISDTDGNVFLGYTNNSDHLKFRRYDDSDAEWGNVETLNATASSSPSVTYKNADGRVTTSWVESNAVSYRHAVSPYGAADWKAETTFYNTGTNAAVTSVGNQETTNLELLWTNGAGNPYTVLSDFVAMAAPTVAITSAATSPTKTSPIPITVQFSAVVTGFVVGDITVGNGTAGGFVAVDGDTYTADITPSGEGAVTVDVAGAVAAGDFGSNAAATQFSITYDSTVPTVAITSSATSPTSTSPIPVTFQFSETVTGFVVGDVTVGNGSAGSFVAVDGDTYTANITPSGQGAVTVDVAGSVATDAATNNNSAATQFSISYDSAAPTVVIGSTASSTTNTSPIPITVEFSETVTGFVVGDVTVGNGTKSNFVAVDGNSYTLDITPSADGAVTVNIAGSVAVDGAGNNNTAATQFSITYDATAPTVVIGSTATSPTNTSPIPVTIEFSETVTGFVVGDVTVGNGTKSNFVAVDGNSYTLDVTPSADGAVTVNVAGSVAVDGAGNNNTAATQFSIAYDATAPTVVIGSTATSPTNVSPIPITIEFSETVTGFVVGDVTVGNGTKSNFVAVDGNSYTLDVTPSTAGAVTVNIAGSVAADAATNNNMAATQFSVTYDATAPTVVIGSTASSPTNTSPIPITVEFSENVTGFVVGDVTVGNGAKSNFAAVDGNSYTLDVTPTADGAVTVNIAGSVAVDAAGNNNTAATQLSRTYDNTVPTVGITNPTVAVNLTNQSSFAVAGTCSENGRSVAVNAGSSGGGAAVSATPNCSAGAWSASLNLSSLGDGTITVIANHEDAVALDAVQASRTVIKEVVAPTGGISSSAANPTSSSPIPIAIEFSETVNGFVAGDITVTNGSVSGFTAVDGNSYSALITPSANGVVTAQVAANKVQDVYGNDNVATSLFSITFTAEQDEEEDNPDEDDDELEELSDEICSVWNGYFNGEDDLVWNILEHVNSGESELRIQTTLYSFDGVSQSSTEFVIAPQQQFDLLAHDMQGWMSDSYGLVCSKVVGSGDVTDLDGRMVYFKRDPEGGFEYIFAAGFDQGQVGNQYVGFNTYQPSLNPSDGDNFIANWIQITNLEDEAQTGELRFYNQAGELLLSKEVHIAAKGQSDSSAHDWDLPTVGFVVWRPTSNTARFVLRNTRYLYDNAKLENRFDGVFQVQGTTGEQEMVSVLLDTAEASSILEIANITDAPRSVVAKFYNSDGQRLAELKFTLDEYSSQHIIADAILEDGTGSVTVEAPGATRKSFMATVFQYGRESDGGVAYLYGVAALRPVGDVLMSSYNTFLNQGCDLYLNNPSDAEQSVTVSMQRNNGAQIFADNVISLGAKQSIVSNVCAAESQESYGVLTLSATGDDKFNSYLLRKDLNGTYRYPIAVR